MFSKSLQACLTLFDPIDCILPGSSVYGILQYWSGLLYAPPGDLPNPGIKPESLMSNLHWQASSLLLVPTTLLLGITTTWEAPISATVPQYMLFELMAELVTHYWLYINMDLLILSEHTKITYFYDFNRHSILCLKY